MGADLVFTGGVVFTDEATTAGSNTSVAVADGRIAAVGGDEVADLADASTVVVDLAGRMLVPGFQDAHIHPVQGGLLRLGCDLADVETEADYVHTIASYARAHPELTWVTGAGWMMAAFPGGMPRREPLDRVLAERPCFFPNRDHHGAWVNSRALQLAGITADTPDPADGRIERDPDGTPTGVLHEGAMRLVSDLVPAVTPELQTRALLEAQAYLHSLGITAWQDAILGTYSTIADASGAYRDCARSGELTAKVVGALWWERDRGLEQIDDLRERRRRFSHGRFQATSVKIMQDGVAENFTAGMTTPYLDACGHLSDNTGLSMVDPVALGEYVTALDAHGFQVHVHAIGDRAVREALDAFEVARACNGPNDLRHHIAHIQVVHPGDIARFARLGVVATMQPLWAAHEPQMDELTIPFLGPERTTWQYPFAALVESGARLAGGSDWPVTSPNPLWGIHVAVNRAVPPAAGQVRGAFLPDQALDAETALAAYTSGSAYVNHLDGSGRIETGAAADLVVLDRDILAAPPDEIGEAVVDETYVEGQAVYRR